MITLSKRLSEIASMVSKGDTAADIGTDHGFVPIFLVENGIVSRAIASDVRKGPLARAGKHIEEAGLSDRIETRLGDGLSAVAPGEADRVIIAGMGGKLMVRILEDSKEVTDEIPELILSPHRDAYDVRKYLSEHNFVIADETMAEEDGKFYPVILAKNLKWFSEEEKSVFSPDDQWTFGPVLLKKRPETFNVWLRAEEATINTVIEKIRNAEDSARNRKLLAEKTEYKNRIRALL